MVNYVKLRLNSLHRSGQFELCNNVGKKKRKKEKTKLYVKTKCKRRNKEWLDDFPSLSKLVSYASLDLSL